MPELQVVPKADIVPGVMRCDSCNFELTRVNLNVNVGTVTAGDNTEEPCPNGCGPLRPVTWRERATQAEKWGEEQFDRAVAAEKTRDALRALWLEWLDGLYDGPDLLRRVRLAVHGPLRKPDGTPGVALPREPETKGGA
jgi:hypothetical protein